MRSLAELTPTEFDALLQRTDAAKAADRDVDREIRRTMRERSSNSP
jgi:hypothetical protein